jgi:hypothetical protein
VLYQEYWGQYLTCHLRIIKKELNYKTILKYKTMGVLDGKTPEEIYLDWLNNFVSIEFMAEFYEVDFKLLFEKIKEGRELYKQKYN